SWAMPPLVFPRAIQVSRLLKQLSLLNWDVMVMAADPTSVQRGVPIDPALERFYAGSLNITHVKSPEQGLLLRALFRCIPSYKQAPDEQRFWVPDALAAVEHAAKSGAFAAMVSFAQPWSSHTVASEFRRKIQLPWIAHFSDPWTENPYRQKSGWAY